eukprot:Gb_21765 [translate_table: standard]
MHAFDTVTQSMCCTKSSVDCGVTMAMAPALPKSSPAGWFPHQDHANSYPSSSSSKYKYSHMVKDYKKMDLVLDARLIESSNPRTCPLLALVEKPAITRKEKFEFQDVNGTDDSRWKEALGMLHSINQLNSHTYASLLHLCTCAKALAEGKRVHAHMLKSGIQLNVFLGTKLVSMYVNCGSLGDARQVFDELPMRNVYICSAMIGGYARNMHYREALTLFRQMHLGGVKPDSFVITSVLPACANLAVLELGKEIHAYVVKIGLELDVFVGNALIDMYGKCQSLENARQVFDKMSQRDYVSWNSMIGGYAQNGHSDEALKLFIRMQLLGKKPDVVTWNAMIAGYAQSGHCDEAFKFFRQMERAGIMPTVISWTSMIAGYAQNGRAEEAWKIFCQMQLTGIKPNVVTWTAMIVGYAKNGHPDEALRLFGQMQLAGFTPNSITVTSVLWACTRLEALRQSKEIHAYVVKSLFHSDIIVGNAFIDMYAKCLRLENARQIFDKLSQRDVVSWNAMIAGYARSGHSDEALRLFRQMQLSCTKPNTATIVSILPACAHLASLQHGKEIHDYVIRSGFVLGAAVGSALVDMYAKCGSIELARHVFDKISETDVISWTTMIVGYAMHGHGKDALTLFDKMLLMNLEPDHITFIGVLSACSHAGLVDKGWHYFDCMSRDYHIIPSVKHYACMVDLLGRAGRLDDAHELINKMPIEPDATVWGALLGACRIHCNIELGECVAGHLFELDPGNPGNYVLLSHIYATAGRWVDVVKVRTMMKDKALKWRPGCSWIEVRNEVHTFLAGDRSHPQREKIYAMLESLGRQMKEAGYVPDVNFVMHDVEEDKEKE